MKPFLFCMFFVFCYCLRSFSQAKKTNSSPQALVTEIDYGLKNIMENYRNQPNTTTTWSQIRNEVDRFLYGYFRSGKLLGSKPQEAYFIQIGMQTMTQADTAANRKVLIAGISVQKPAEFVSITVETSSKPVSKKSVF